MNLRFVAIPLVVLGLLGSTFLLHAADAPAKEAHFDDPEKLLPSTPSHAQAFDAKLAKLERATGLRIFARIRAKSPTEAEDAQPGAFMRTLAEKFGTEKKGALAVYFADEDDWRVWIGDDLTARFVGRPGTAQELTASGAIHDVKEAFLKAVQATAAAELRLHEAARVAAHQPPLAPGLRIKLQTDAILDGLIAKLQAHQ